MKDTKGNRKGEKKKKKETVFMWLKQGKGLLVSESFAEYFIIKDI